MMKAAYFCLFTVIGTLFFPANAAELPENFDPLEERMKIEGAYIPNYRELMRDVVIALGRYARENDPAFQIYTDGGHQLLIRGQWENDLDDLHRAELAGAKSDDERFLLKLFSPEHPVPAGSPVRRYLAVIDGLLVSDMICGGGKGKISSETEKIVKEYGLAVIGTEHCDSGKDAKSARTELARKKIPAHTDTDKQAAYDTLPEIPELFMENPDNVDSVAKVRNMLILTNTRKFQDKDLMIRALGATNYDLLIVDPFFKNSIPLTKEDVKELQTKKVGAKRQVFAVLDITKAQDTRPYWKNGWKQGEPVWLRLQSKTDPSGVIVDFWNPEWKRILGVYFKSIMDLGFNGIVLQGLDEHIRYENIIPIQ